MHLSYNRNPNSFPTPINSSIDTNIKSSVDDDYIQIPILTPSPHISPTPNTSPRINEINDGVFETIKESKHRHENEKYYILDMKLNNFELRFNSKFGNVQESLNFLAEELTSLKSSFNEIKNSVEILQYNYLKMMNNYTSKDKSFIPIDENKTDLPPKKKSLGKEPQKIIRIGSSNSLNKKIFK